MHPKQRWNKVSETTAGLKQARSPEAGGLYAFSTGSFNRCAKAKLDAAKSLGPVRRCFTESAACSIHTTERRCVPTALHSA
jgi:hypothetical protein